jgi:multiple sugar transport system substrate-binding protein
VSSQSEFQELAYLFLQWSGSTRIFSLMTGNPGGFFDPCQLANFADPLVNQSYHDYHAPVIKGTVARAVPTLAIPGQFAMHNTAQRKPVNGDDRRHDCQGSHVGSR